MLVSRTGSDPFQDRDPQLAVRRSTFDKKANDRMVYVCTPERAERSDLIPLALEHGHWRERVQRVPWRLAATLRSWRREGEWRIEAGGVHDDGLRGCGLCPSEAWPTHAKAPDLGHMMELATDRHIGLERR